MAKIQTILSYWHGNLLLERRRNIRFQKKNTNCVIELVGRLNLNAEAKQRISNKDAFLEVITHHPNENSNYRPFFRTIDLHRWTEYQ